MIVCARDHADCGACAFATESEPAPRSSLSAAWKRSAKRWRRLQGITSKVFGAERRLVADLEDVIDGLLDKDKRRRRRIGNLEEEVELLRAEVRRLEIERAS